MTGLYCTILKLLVLMGVLMGIVGTLYIVSKAVSHSI